MHKNEQLLRDFVEGLQTKDMPKVAACFKSDLKWRWLGFDFITDVKPGTYVGLAEVAETLNGIDSKITNYKIETIKALTANDDIGTFWNHCSYTDADGVHQDMEENWVFLFEDGLISEVWDYNRILFLEKRRNGEVA